MTADHKRGKATWQYVKNLDTICLASSYYKSYYREGWDESPPVNQGRLTGFVVWPWSRFHLQTFSSHWRPSRQSAFTARHHCDISDAHGSQRIINICVLACGATVKHEECGKRGLASKYIQVWKQFYVMISNPETPFVRMSTSVSWWGKCLFSPPVMSEGI